MRDIDVNLDTEGKMHLDFYDLLCAMPAEAKQHAALLLANQTDVMLFVAQLLADGITFDANSRFYFPSQDEMQKARLYIIDKMDDLQSEAIKKAIADRDQAVDEAAKWESTARYLAGGIEWTGSNSEQSYYRRLHDAEEKAAAWEAENGRRIR